MLYRKLIFSLIIQLVGLFAIAEEGRPTLTVRITGIEPGEGQVVLSLFTSEENYLKQPVMDRTLPAGPSSAVEARLTDLPPGTYAVSVFYDQDGDGELKTGFLGIPRELVGFSNNAKGRFGPPGFEDTSFEVSGDTAIEIRLGKAKD